MLLLVFSRPHYGSKISQDLFNFRAWLENCKRYANDICSKDKQLAEFIADRRIEVETANKDFKVLTDTAVNKGWDGKTVYAKSMSRMFADSPGLSLKAKRSITNKFFNDVVEARQKEGRPFTVDYIINRASSLDWSVLDFFYQLTGFSHFKKMIDLAENHGDEGPVCNLALIADYLSKFMEQYGPVISAGYLRDDRFQQCLYTSFTYALWRLAETEFEDEDDPFPSGRISFLTIHQSKGLEFPVVVLGNLYKGEGESDIKEVTVRKLLKKEQEGEPLPLISKFDNMRMFYVALSRAENLLVLPRYAGSGQRISEEFKMLFEKFAYKEIGDFDFNDLDGARLKPKDTAEIYSYTSDYMLYKRCPRQYMFLRKYEFSGSRTQMMMFGSLVHQTIEDLHHLLIEEREKEPLL
jgi:DNA helicase-2/ATP-dependent DNA helicase PcrA